MNNYDEMVCAPTEESRDEGISDIVRGNSGTINSIFSELCKVSESIFMKGIERDIKKEEPRCMRDEVLWQRSMLERIGDEILELQKVLGMR